MAKRLIDTDLWNDPKIDEFTADEKYFWLFLLTTHYGNLAGCFEVSVKQISRTMGLSEKKVSELIESFKKHELIDYDTQTQELLILNWYKYNWTKSSKLLSSLEKFIEKIKNPSMKEYVKKLYEGVGGEYGIDTVSIPYRYLSIPIPNTISNTNSNSIKEKNNIKKESYGEFKNVMLSEEEMTKLNNRYGNKVIADYIERVSLYIENSGKRYKSHYATLLNWLKKDGNREIPQMDDDDGLDDPIWEMLKNYGNKENKDE